MGGEENDKKEKSLTVQIFCVVRDFSFLLLSKCFIQSGSQVYSWNVCIPYKPYELLVKSEDVLDDP